MTETPDVALLRRAVSLYSPSGLEGEVARFLAGEMGRCCDEALIDASGSAVGRWGAGPLTVYVLGHIDTFPGELPVYLTGGRLYGRGSVDAKGPFCAAIAAVARLDPALKSRLTVRLIGATEEEAPSSRGARHALAVYPKPDLLIVGEPSGWDAVTLGYKGRLVLRLMLEKPETHSAGQDSSAAEDMLGHFLALKAQAERHYAPGSTFDSLQIRLQSFDTHTDGLTQRAEALVGYRLPPSLDPEGLGRELRAVLGVGVSAVVSGAERAVRSSKDTPLSRAFRLAIRSQGGRARLKLKTGTSDMNVVAPVWDVPMLAYGPGDSSLDHTPDEHVVLQDYEKAVAVLATALERLAERQRPESS